MIVLVGEEADLYNMALGRDPDGLQQEADPICETQRRFWSDYQSVRSTLGIESAER